MKKKTLENLIVCVVLYAVMIWAWISGSASLKPEAMLFPKIVISVMALLNTILLVKGFTEKGSEEAKLSFKVAKYPFAVFLAAIVYVLIFRHVNYIVATGVMACGLMFAFKVRPVWKIALIVGGYLVVAYILFAMALKVPIM